MASHTTVESASTLGYTVWSRFSDKVVWLPPSTHTHTTCTDFSSPSPSPMDQMVEVVELMKPERAGLGLLIWEQGDPGVYVKEVVKNGAAYNNMRIQPGDKILAINGQDISNAGQSIVYQMLQVRLLW